VNSSPRDTGVSEEERSNLISHLTELRARLIRALVYVILGMAAVWFAFDPLFLLLTHPIVSALGEETSTLHPFTPFEGAFVRLGFVLVGGVVVALPFIMYEIWAFVAPGLTRAERRSVGPFIPVAMLLFFLGVSMAYVLTGPAVRALFYLNPPNTEPLLNLNQTVLQLIRFYLAFGICFQIPIIIVVLAKLGIVDSRLLISRWREAVIIIFVVAAVVTPTWDPITLTAAALPVVVLYAGTIAVVKLIERGRRRANEDEPAG
jgi:sec-independent protein translocase protein TatC